jgi:uncharacterized protein YuzE
LANLAAWQNRSVFGTLNSLKGLGPLKQSDEVDPALEHRLGVVPDVANRVLRVIVSKGEPKRVITAHLDPKVERQVMKLTIDREADALYLDLDEAPAVETEEISPGVILDYNASGKVVGIEMLYLSKRVSPEMLGRMQMETVGG